MTRIRLATLAEDGTLTAAQIPSSVDEILPYANLAAFPATGNASKIYVAEDTSRIYRWSGSAYVVIPDTLALGETSSTAYRGDRGKTAYDHSQLTTGNPHGTTKGDLGLGNVDNVQQQPLDADLTAIAGLDSSTAGAIASDGAGWIKKTYAQFKTGLVLVKGDVGLGNVDNTSDANKPVSTAQQTALNGKVGKGELVVSVKDFAPDEHTWGIDDSEVIQDAIDYVEALLGYTTSVFNDDGATILFPGDRYVATDLRVSKFGITFEGVGPTATFLVNTHTTNPLLTLQRADADNVLGFFTMRKMQVRNTVTRADGDYPLIYAKKLVRSRFEQVRFTSSGFGVTDSALKCDMFRIDTGYELSFTDCTFSHNIGYALDLLTGDQSDSIVFNNCWWFYNAVAVMLMRGTSASGSSNPKFIGGKMLGAQGGTYVSGDEDQFAKTTAASTSSGTTLEVASGTNFKANRAVIIGNPNLSTFKYALVKTVSGTTITLDRAVSVASGEEVAQGRFGVVVGQARQVSLDGTQLEGLDYGVYSLNGVRFSVKNSSVGSCAKPFYFNNQFRDAVFENVQGDTNGTPKNSVAWKLLTVAGTTDRYNSVRMTQMGADGSGYYSSTTESLLDNLTAYDLPQIFDSRVDGRTWYNKALAALTFVDNSILSFRRTASDKFTRIRWRDNATDKWLLDMTGANADLILKANGGNDLLTCYGSTGEIGIGGGTYTNPIRHGARREWYDSSGNKRVKNGQPSSETDGLILARPTGLGLAPSVATAQVGSVANTTTETALGTITIPANTMAVGSVYRITLGGTYDCIATSGTLSVKARLGNTGGNQLGSNAISSQGSARTASPWQMTFDLVVRAIGVSGSVIAAGSSTIAASTNAATAMNATAQAVNTTADVLILPTAVWATADAGNIIRCEVLDCVQVA